MALNDLYRLKAASAYKQADNGIVHDLRFREAYRLARKTLDEGAEEKVFVLYFLGISLAGDILSFRDKFRMASPVVRIISANIDGRLCRYFNICT